MAIKNLSDVHITAGLQDKDGQLGTSGQILASTGSQVDWIDQGDIVVGEADKAKSVTIRVKNSTATAMSKGQVICEAVSANPPNGNLIEVALADNNGTNTMPALGILNEDLDAAGGANDEGDAIMFGKVSGINTSAFSVGDEVFVDDTPGGLTITKPTGTKYIQKVGVVIRDDASNGTIEVFGAGRVNDVPTPLYVDHANQRLGIGATSPQKTLDVDGEVLLREHLFIGGHGENDSTNSIEIGRNRTGNGICFFDMTTDNTTYTDYGFRLIRWSGVNAETELYHRGTGNFNIKGQEASNVTFSTSNSERMRIASNGNVGIGTTSPSYKLHIAQGEIGISNLAPGFTNAMGSIGAYNQDANNGGLIFKTIQGSTLSEKVRILANGNVGIGTASPGKTLDVNGDIRLRGAYQFLEGESPTTRLRNMTALPGGYVESNTFNFRFDESATAYAGESHDIGGTINQTTGTAIPDVNLKRLFTYTASYINLNTHKDSNNNVVIELDGISVSNSANNQWKPYVLFHAESSGVATMTIEVKNGAGNWETVENAIDCVDFYIRDGFYTTSQGVLKGVRFTFTNISSNSYLRMIGVIGKTHASYQWNVLKSGSKMFGDLDFGDTKRATFGDGEDLRILHESNNSYIHHTGAGSLYMKADAGDIQIINYTNDSDIVLASDNGSGGTTPYLTIDGSTTHAHFSNPGNVGIGTTSPSAKLDVAGNVNTDNSISIQGLDTGNPSASSEELRLSGYGVLGNRSAMYITNGHATGTMRFGVGGSGGNHGSNTKMVLNASGNLGIGTTSPGYKLDVAGEVRANNLFRTTDGTNIGLFGSSVFASNVIGVGSSNAVPLVLGTSATERMRITSTGNVGIGTSSPGEKLDVSGNIQGNNLYLNHSTVPGLYMERGDGLPQPVIQLVKSNDNLLIGNTAIDEVIFYDDAGEAMRLDGSGNLGIGTTSPDTKLRVNGVVKANSVRVGSSNNMELFDYSNSLHIYSASGSQINLGGGIGNRQNDVNVGNGNLTVNGSARVANDSDAASASKAGALRYRTSGNNSYVDMCMRTGATTYAWVNIVQNNW